MTPDEHKKMARKAAFAARRIAHTQGLDDVANAHLTAFLLDQPASVIAGYMPIQTEISPLPTMLALHEAGRTIAVPVIKAEGSALAFHIWKPECQLVEGPFGAKVPADGHPVTPDLLITPLVAYDQALNRLGYGGGYYDRSLAELRANKPTPAIGFAYLAQKTEALPVGAFDIPLDLVVTEIGLESRV